MNSNAAMGPGSTPACSAIAMRHEVAVEHEVEQLRERPFALGAYLLDAADDLFLE